MLPQKSFLRRPGLVLLLLVAAITVPYLLRGRNSENRTLILYCAHDSIFAESIIQTFESRTGIRVQVRYDEEANKSLGLTNLLIAEKSKPRCDVFWNNQTSGTLRLKKEGVLARCRPDLYSRIPAAWKDPDHYWAGFAARFRVYIVNTERMLATEDAVATALRSESLSRAAIAAPLFGTTLSHYCVLCDSLGLDGLKQWHQSLHHRGIREVRGNGAVRDLVAEGACDLGFTDTDDAFAAIDAGKPVAMLPVRSPAGKTVCLPNCVAMIAQCPHPDAAMLFIEYLLSEETELALANSSSRQIPLGLVDESLLTAEVQQLLVWAEESVLPEAASNHEQEVLDWLAGEYTGG